MQNERTFIDDLKYQYNHGGMTIRLIIVNTAIFLGIQILFVFGRLIGGSNGEMIHDAVYTVFALKTDLYGFVRNPWGLITSIFAHFTLIHFLLNMLFLYFAGRMFESVFDSKRLVYTYWLGGILGGILEILAHLLPALSSEAIVVVGASGSIMAIFAAMAFYRPNLKVYLFGMFPVRLIFVAGFFILSDLISLGMNDGTAHFAHIGGFIIGLVSIQQLNSNRNIIDITQRFVQRFKDLFKPKSKLKVTQRKPQNPRFKTDEEYNLDSKLRQEKIDAILDKISKSGYESLTKAEKEFLFNQSKNG